VLSYDPDSAGQGAAARSSELLVGEGFQVNVAALPAGQDPDVFVRRQGVEAYVEALKGSRPYLEFLLDRAAQARDLSNDEARREFLREMLGVAARIPDAAGRDQFADRLAHKARITEDVVRAEIRKAAVERRTALTTRELPNYGQVKPAEKGLIWHLVNEPAAALSAMEELDDLDLAGLPTRHVLEAAREIREQPAEHVPSALLARLNTEEAALVSAMAAAPEPPVMTASDCTREIRRLRFERERAALQREIEQLRDEPGSEGTIIELYRRKIDLQHQIELLR
jgi:DNA primase